MHLFLIKIFIAETVESNYIIEGHCFNVDFKLDVYIIIHPKVQFSQYRSGFFILLLLLVG